MWMRVSKPDLRLSSVQGRGPTTLSAQGAQHRTPANGPWQRMAPGRHRAAPHSSAHLARGGPRGGAWDDRTRTRPRPSTCGQVTLTWRASPCSPSVARPVSIPTLTAYLRRHGIPVPAPAEPPSDLARPPTAKLTEMAHAYRRSGRSRDRGIQRDRRGDGQARGRSRSPVVLAARRCERIEALPKELPDAVAVPTDVTDAEQVRAMVDTAVQCYGRVDMLVNNAAGVAARPRREHRPRGPACGVRAQCRRRAGGAAGRRPGHAPPGRGQHRQRLQC